MKIDSNPSAPIATELLELSRHLAASQMSVKRLRQLIDQNSASLTIDELIVQELIHRRDLEKAIKHYAD